MNNRIGKSSVARLTRRVSRATHNRITGNILLCAATSLFLNTSFAGFTVIGNPHLPFDHLTANQVKHLYTNKSINVASHVDLQVFDQPGESKINTEFYQKLFHWSPQQVTDYWSRYVFTGQGSPPPKVSDSENAIAVVEGTPGAISYIDNKYLSMAKGNVKFLYPKQTNADLFKPQSHKQKIPHASKSKPKPKTTDAKKSDSTKENQQTQQDIAKINAALHQKSAKKNAQKTEQKTTQKPEIKAAKDKPISWSQLTKGFTLQNNANKPKVRQQITDYLENKDQLEVELQKLFRHLNSLYKQVKTKKLPPEYSLYPLITGNFNTVPNAVEKHSSNWVKLSALSQLVKYPNYYDLTLPSQRSNSANETSKESTAETSTLAVNKASASLKEIVSNLHNQST